VRAQAEDRAEERILDALLPKRQLHGFMGEPQQPDMSDSETRQKLRKQLREGALDEREIEIETAVNVGVEIMAPPGMEEMTSQLRGMFSSLAGSKTQKRKLAIKAARPLLIDEEAAALVNDEEIKARWLRASRTASSSSTKSTRSASAASGAARASAVKACSATCCPWSRVPPCRPSTAASTPITSCSSPPALFRWPSRRT
jgi:hypothetical protein